MIAVFITNEQQELLHRVREHLGTKYPGETLSLGNPARYTVQDLEIPELSFVVCQRGYEHVAEAFEGIGAEVMMVDPEERDIVKAPPEDDAPPVAESPPVPEGPPPDQNMIDAILATSVPKIRLALPTLNSSEFLTAMLHTEEAGQRRKTALSAIAARLAEVSG